MLPVPLVPDGRTICQGRSILAEREGTAIFIPVTNTVESHFALLKRGVYGTFHNISEAHLHRYLAEFDFRANTRDLSDDERAALLLAGAQGKRLLYRQPNRA